MSAFTGIRSVTLIIAACLALVLLQRGTFSSTSPDAVAVDDFAASSGDKMDANPIPKLAITLRQTGTSPPKLAVKVTNNNQGVVTVLTWDSPLDKAALALGLFAITPAGASVPLELPTVQFRRVSPPGPESFVEIAPGASAEREVLLKEPTVSEDDIFAGKDSAKVLIKGSWHAVWAKARTDITDQEIDSREQSFSGDFKSDEIEIKRTLKI